MKEQGQPVASFPWYALRNLVRLRMKYMLSDITRRDFDSLELLQTVGVRTGVNLAPEQWEQFAWLWYEPLGRCARVEDDITPDARHAQEHGPEARHRLQHLRESRLAREAPEESSASSISSRSSSTPTNSTYVSPARSSSASRRRRSMCPPENILFVGDRIDNDILPAMGIGMRAALKEAYTNAGKRMPHRGISNPPPRRAAGADPKDQSRITDPESLEEIGDCP